MTEPIIFGAVAAGFYARGIPVIPLHFHDKKPIPTKWSRFHDTLPNPDEQADWIRSYSTSNIGVVLGAQSGLCVMDIDTTDANQQNMLLAILPDSPWQRVGKKGMVLAFKFSGHSTFRIKDVNGNTLVELLSTRTQVVLPPSVHPETQLPYSENCPLLDVMDQLPTLDPQIEQILRGAFKDMGVDLSLSGHTRVTDWTPTGARDVQMTRIAGHYAYGVVRGELPLKEALERMAAWYASSVEKVAGDDVEIEKGMQNLVTFVSRDVLEKGKILPIGWDLDLSAEEKKEMGLEFTKEHEEWSFDELKDYLRLGFEEHPPESAGRMNAINFALDKIAKARDLNPLDQDRLFRYIGEAGGMRMTVGSLRARVKDLSHGEMKGKDHAEIARAVLIDLEKYGPIRFYASKFWTWSGSDWVEKPRNEILRLIVDNYGSLDAARRNSDHNGIMKTLSSLVPQVIKTVDLIGVNFANGMLTDKMELVPHDQAYGMTYTLPFRYLPETSGKAFRFMDFLERSWGKDEDYAEKVMALQEAICVTIFGYGPMFQRAMLLFGPPRTGKSQLLRIVSALVPEEAKSTCPPDLWGDRFAPTTMHGALINVCGELSEKRKIDGQRFKQIVDGEEMAGQLKGQQLFTFRPKCTHWFASNHLPKTEDTSAAFNRRWLILQFNHPVGPSERIMDLGEIIAAEEREAITAWAVEALPRVMERREYMIPSSHEILIAEVAALNNSILYFILESGKVVLNSGEKTLHPISELKLHDAYWSFCLGAGGVRPVTPREFRQKMRELGAELGFKRIMRTTEKGFRECVYSGLTLVADKAG